MRTRIAAVVGAAVLAVAAVVEALAVVQEREELDDVHAGAVASGQQESVHADARPVRRAVDAAPFEAELALQRDEQVGREARAAARHRRCIPSALFDGSVPAPPRSAKSRRGVHRRRCGTERLPYAAPMKETGT